MRHQPLHPGQRGFVGAVHGGLCGEPFVQHVGFVAVDLLEAGQRPFGIIGPGAQQRLQGTQTVGQVVRTVELGTGQSGRAVGACQREQLQRRVAQRPLPDLRHVQRIRRLPVPALCHLPQPRYQWLHDAEHGLIAPRAQPLRIQRRELLGQAQLVGQQQHLLAQAVVQPGIRQRGHQCIGQRLQGVPGGAGRRCGATRWQGAAC